MRFSNLIYPISIIAVVSAGAVVDRRAAFTLKNGQEAQALNRKFQSLSANSACKDGEQACIKGQFAQCTGGKFALSSCGASLQCVALPLVNKPGTSITCDTQQDAVDRISRTGATGGLVGKREVEEEERDEHEIERRAAFTLKNGQDAQALNRKFQSLSANSPCTTNEVGCIKGQFAKCDNGKFVLSPCAATLQCVALPLVNSPGTSVTCDTKADAAARIGRTGAKGGLLGKRDDDGDDGLVDEPVDEVPSEDTTQLVRRAAFTLKNGQEAQALNRKFEGLTANSPCKDGEDACINGQFAQCAGGKFALTSCGTLQCVALPLVNSPGTSVTCDTKADAVARIARTGAKGGLLGKREFEPEQRTVEARAATAPPACAAKGKREDITLAPMNLLKRIAQSDLGQVAQSWQNLCVKSGGVRNPNNDPCVQLAGVNGISSLLANADACAQQDNADAMVDFAKSKGIKNKQALINNAIAYRKHPRNALNINGVVPSTLFCEKAPRNAELKGVANAQLQGVNPGLFGSPKTGIVAFGASGTCPFGKKADVATCTCR
ncbi:hypothetical protein B0F90DRAFT_407732 [Multifurca ochricompacta]|uniref:Carbohydrate-binding module family 19 domain-containing protein n=1 Tax=Multifurca ochricompacta TaxID=376703 RepID=A0AAD4LU85_9AGAM|nr:hypothetical protein B0F90DRAFT_407732 [Multifurca ochricompacta]